MGDRPVTTHSARSVVMGCNGMIATSQPLATAAGLQVLMEGGTAIDAAITASAVLGVVEPFAAGIGGDSFALLWDPARKELFGLNGSGRSAALLDPVPIRAAWSQKSRPWRGVHSVTVPGAVDSWFELHHRHGSIPMEDLLQPAIRYARDGFPVSEIIASQWSHYSTALTSRAARDVFLPAGIPPKAGEVFRNERYADSLTLIARYGRDAFYYGPIAEKIISEIQTLGGSLSEQDLRSHRSQWVEPVSTDFDGIEVFELPPNGQGAVVLEMLNILENFDLRSMGHNSAAYIHTLVQAKRAAFRDRDRYIADPDTDPEIVECFTSKDYAKEIADRIRSGSGPFAYRDVLPSSDTVYLAVSDSEGCLISYISSIFSPFGSGVVPASTGILLQNRGSLFSLEEGHPNSLAPSKRPLHTIIPAMAFQNGSPWLCYGVMGGDMQPQGHVQVLLNMLAFGMDIQEAGEAPRFCDRPTGLALESGIPWGERQQLLSMGYNIISEFDVFGGFQGIQIDQTNGVYRGGSDDRKDGCAMGY